jgi:hypothetical protein
MRVNIVVTRLMTLTWQVAEVAAATAAMVLVAVAVGEET